MEMLRDWRCKALVMQLSSRLPAGERILYWLQRRVMHTFPTSPAKFREIFQFAARHVDRLKPFSRSDRKLAVFYEFGAGRDLAIPLAFYSLGVERQILVDMRKLLKLELANSTIQMLQNLAGGLAIPRVPNKLFSMKEGDKWLSQLEEWYGIRYLAPCDARRINLPDQSIDFITSTNTMEHIPSDDILQILTEFRRQLKPDGAMSFIIDYQDHYSYFDKAIGPYNFLKYSPSTWKAFNPDLHFQNRLRHKDYRRLADLSGLVVESETLTETAMSDLKSLQGLAIHPSFAEKYTVDELAIRRAHFVLRKNGAQGSEPARPEFLAFRCE